MGMLFKPKRRCSNKVLATKNSFRPSIVKRQRTVKKVLYVNFFVNKGPVMLLPVQMGRTVTGAFELSVQVLFSNILRHASRDAVLTGLKYLRILHDNGPPIRHALCPSFLSLKR